MTSALTSVNKEATNSEAVKTIGLISDTHIPKRAMCVPKRVFEIFENVDYIIHAGDLVELSVIDELEQIAPVLAVRGNMDTAEVSGAFPDLNSLRVFDWKIGVIHNPEAATIPGGFVEIAQKNSFKVLVSGHTHSPRIKWDGEILSINPGSPTDPSSFLNKPSVGLLKITKKIITPQIITL